MRRKFLILIGAIMFGGCGGGERATVEVKFKQVGGAYIPRYLDSITVTVTGDGLSSPLIVPVPLDTGFTHISVQAGRKRFVAEARGLREDIPLWRGEVEYNILPQVSQSVEIHMNLLPTNGFLHDPINDLLSQADSSYDINGVYVKSLSSPEPSLLFRLWTLGDTSHTLYLFLLDLDQNPSTSFQFSGGIAQFIPSGFGPDAGAIVDGCNVKLFYEWFGEYPVVYQYPSPYSAICLPDEGLLEFSIPLTAAFNDDLNINFMVFSIDFTQDQFIVVDVVPDSGYGTFGSGSTSPVNPFLSYAEGLLELVAGSTYGEGGDALGSPLGDSVNSIYYDGNNIFISASIYGESNYHGVVRRIDTSTSKIYNLAGIITRSPSDFADAEFPLPVSIGDAGGIWVSSSGIIYISDPVMCVIRSINPVSGTSSIVAGVPGECGYNGDGKGVMINYPSSIFLDERTQEVYFADTLNHLIRKVGADGIVVTVAGNYAYRGACTPTDEVSYSGPATGACLNTPYGIYPTEGTSGIIGFYIADSGNHIIRYVDITSQPPFIIHVAGTGYEGVPISLPSDPLSVSFYEPHYLFYNGNYLFIVDVYYNTHILAMSMLDGRIYDTGIVMTGTPGGMSGDQSSLIYVDFPYIKKADISSGFPVSVTQTIGGSGFKRHGGDGGRAVNASIDYPVGLTYTGGNLYFGEKYLGTLYRVNLSSGILERVAGNGTVNYECSSIPLLGAKDFPVFNSIVDIAGDASGNLFVADDGVCVIRKVDFTSSSIDVVAGNCTCDNPEYGSDAVSTFLSHPTAIAVAGDGTIYVAQYSSSLGYAFVDEILSDGKIYRFAGGATSPVSFPSSLTAGELSLFYVSSLSVSTDGSEVYIVDGDISRVYAVHRSSKAVRVIYSPSSSVVISPGIVKSNLYLLFPIYDAVPVQNGQLFLSSPFENKVYGFLEGGIQYRIAGGPYNLAGFKGTGGKAKDALIYYPTDIAVGSNGELFISLLGVQGIGSRIVRIVPR